jgi:hypothetical protein
MVQSIGCIYITQHASQYHPNSRTNMTNKMIMTTYDKSNSLLTVINKSCYHELQGLGAFGGGAMNGMGGIWNPGMVGIVVGTVVGMDGIVVGIEGIGGRIPGIAGMVGTVVGIAGFGRDGIVPAAAGGRATFGTGMDGIGGTVTLGTAGMGGTGGTVDGTVGVDGIGGSVLGPAGIEG